MKYASEVIGLLAAYPGREFKMAQIVRDAARASTLSPRQHEAVRKGVQRVLNGLIESGQVERMGGDTKSASYAWRLLGHEVSPKAGYLGHSTGQYAGTIAP